MTLSPRLRILAFSAFGLLSSGCFLFRGAVNASPGLRWWLFSHFGAERFCPEMLKRGASLRLVPDGNAIGRFFPTSCRSRVDDAQHTLTLEFAGTGYAWTPVAGRVGFAADAGIEYRPDFRMEDDAVYVWAKSNRVVSGPNFALGGVENRLANWAAHSTPGAYLASTFGSQIVQSQLASGFTVVHTDGGDDFAIGILTPPARPKHPFHLDSDERLMLANETTEIRSGQVDFLGPFEVAENDQALFIQFQVTGPSVDVLVMQREAGDPWREGLQQGTSLGPPLAPPASTFVVAAGALQKQRIRLPVGHYYLVVDNSDKVGSVAPAWNPISMFGAGSAVVAYSVELGDAG